MGSSSTSASDAATVAADCFLSDQARELLRAGLSAPEFLWLLREHELLPDALRFLALLLPKRVAVWWGCQCVWHFGGHEMTPASSAALQTAVRWVQDPSEANRRATEGPGQSAGLEDPAGCLAMAAFWSGGSMTPPHLPPVAPPPFITGRLVGGALLLASVLHEPLECRAHYRTCLELGLEAAEGRNLWFAASGEVRPGGVEGSVPASTSVPGWAPTGQPISV